MGEAGIFAEDDRVELLDGEIYVMAPIGNDHSGGLRGLNYVFNAAVRGAGPVDVTAHDGMMAVAIGTAAEISAREHRVVEMAELEV